MKTTPTVGTEKCHLPISDNSFLCYHLQVFSKVGSTRLKDVVKEAEMLRKVDGTGATPKFHGLAGMHFSLTVKCVLWYNLNSLFEIPVFKFLFRAEII